MPRRLSAGPLAVHTGAQTGQHRIHNHEKAPLAYINMPYKSRVCHAFSVYAVTGQRCSTRYLSCSALVICRSYAPVSRKPFLRANTRICWSTSLSTLVMISPTDRPRRLSSLTISVSPRSRTPRFLPRPPSLEGPSLPVPTIPSSLRQSVWVRYPVHRRQRHTVSHTALRLFLSRCDCLQS
jgi:hypothetical protein